MNVRTTSKCALVVALLSVGCSKSEEPAEEATEALEQTAQPAEAPAEEGPKVTPPEGAKVMFVEPTDGAEVKGPLVDGKVTVPVKMAVEGITVQAAGEQVEGTGHHHLVVDGEHIPLAKPVPKDDTHIHYGQGQTETELMLEPGEHTLTMQFADGIHLSYGEDLSQTITVKVVADEQAAADDKPKKGKKK